MARQRSPSIANFFLSWFQWFAGTSFPANPFTYRPFFRTDLGWLCYWDGTRWLTVHEYSLILTDTTQTANGNNISTRPYRSDYAPFFTRFDCGTFVITTNDGTKYWTVDIKSWNAAYAASTTIVTFNTSADAANANIKHAGTPGTQNPANYSWLDISVTKTSTPGTLILYTTIYHRLIVT